MHGGGGKGHERKKAYKPDTFCNRQRFVPPAFSLRSVAGDHRHCTHRIGCHNTEVLLKGGRDADLLYKGSVDIQGNTETVCKKRRGLPVASVIRQKAAGRHATAVYPAAAHTRCFLFCILSRCVL